MYQLGSLTLPAPKSITRSFMETGAENVLIEGKTTKRTDNRKERFVLTFQNLSRTVADSILSIYDLDAVVAFTVTETNLSISATRVLVDITDREYVKSGGLYKQNMTVILTEVL